MLEHLPGQPGIAQPDLQPSLTQADLARHSGVFKQLRSRWITGITASAIAVSRMVGLDAAPASAVDSETAIVGMPFKGEWAYNVPTNAACGPESGKTSHPSCHEINSGDWSTDLYAAPGTEVTLKVSSDTGTPSFAWESSTGSCGETRRIKVSVDGAYVGRIYVTHMSDAASTDTAPTNGMMIGKIANLTCNPGGKDKNHVHMEVDNTSTNTFACYKNYSTVAHTAGHTLTEGTELGVIGALNNGTKQACSANSTTPKDDYVIYRLDGSTGKWYGKSAPVGTSQINPTWGVSHGSPGDIPVMGDFDGDGYGDFGIYRMVGDTGTWYVKSSGTGGPTPIWGATHGSPGDIPVVGDVNGDRIADFGIYRMGSDDTGRWYFKSGHNGQPTPVWGWDHGSPGDIPVVGDMNGDKVGDLGIFRLNPADSTRYWYFKSGGDGRPTPIWGAAHGWPSDKPVVGDINGDNIADFGIYRVNPNDSTGYWHFKSGHNGQPISDGWGAVHGGPGDVPLIGRLD